MGLPKIATKAKTSKEPVEEITLRDISHKQLTAMLTPSSRDSCAKTLDSAIVNAQEGSRELDALLEIIDNNTKKPRSNDAELWLK